jgi:hypothetical protein
LSDFRVDFFHDGNGSIKSLQRDVIAGRWDDWMLSLVASAWMAAEDRRVVAVDWGRRV